jgi:hypothetical protein
MELKSPPPQCGFAQEVRPFHAESTGNKKADSLLILSEGELWTSERKVISNAGVLARRRDDEVDARRDTKI